VRRPLLRKHRSRLDSLFGWPPDHLRAHRAGFGLVLRVPPASRANTALRQIVEARRNRQGRNGAIRQATAAAAAVILPLLTAVLHASAGKPHSIFDGNAALIKPVELLGGHRNTGAQIGHLSGSNHHAQQNRTWFRRRTGAGLGEIALVEIGHTRNRPWHGARRGHVIARRALPRCRRRSHWRRGR
jgi:hypothetical protein